MTWAYESKNTSSYTEESKQTSTHYPKFPCGIGLLLRDMTMLLRHLTVRFPCLDLQVDTNLSKITSSYTEESKNTSSWNNVAKS